MSKQLTELELESRRWKNRRRMAWISLFYLMLAPVVTGIVVWFSPTPKIETFMQLLEWVMMPFATIVLAYFGFTTWADKNKGGSR